MARSGEVGRFCVVGDCSLDGMCAVGCAYAGGNALCGVDGDGEGGVEACGVVDDLRVKGEGVAFVAGERQADEASAEFSHKVDDLRRDFFGGADEVAFVFAVFIVNKNDDFACAKVVEDVRYLAKLYCHRIRISRNRVFGQEHSILRISDCRTWVPCCPPGKWILGDDARRQLLIADLSS